MDKQLLIISIISITVIELGIYVSINYVHGEETRCSFWIWGCKSYDYKDDCKSYVTDTDLIPMTQWVSNGKTSTPIITFIPITHHHYDCVRTFDNGTVHKWSKED